MKEGKTKNHRCNLVVLGEERVGKTSLIRSILGWEFEPNCESTKGVSLSNIGAGIAERTDIVATEDHWKKVEPLEDIRIKHRESIVKEVSLAVTVGAKKVEEPLDTEKPQVTQEDLMREVEKNLRKMRRPDTQKPLPLQAQTHVGRVHPPVVPGATATQLHSRYDSYIDSDDDDGDYTPYTPVFDYFEDVAPVQQKPPRKPKQKKKTALAPGTKEPRKKRKKRERHRGPPNPSASIATLPYRESRAIGRALKEVKHTPKKVLKSDLTFHTIDFAGQKLYRHMHHCFITRRAMYIVVFKLPALLEYLKNPQEGMTDPFIEIRYWLNNIVAHARLTEEDKSQCKIFLVGTHKNPQDGSQGRPLTDEEVDEINQKLRDLFLIDKKENRFLDSIKHCSPSCMLFPLENSLTDKEDKRGESGIVQLMASLRETSKKLDFLSKKEYPTKWLKFEEKLIEMNEERKEQLLSTTREEVRGWARDCGIDDDEGFSAALTFYHDILVIIDQGTVIMS